MSNYNTSGLSPEMLKIFESLPNYYLVLSRGLDILTASDRYLQLTGKQRNQIVGRNVFEIFPEKPDWTDQDGGMTGSLREVLRTKTANEIPVTRIDIPDPAEPGALRPRWWKSCNVPVFTEEGDIAYIIHQTEDVTAQVLSELQLMTLNSELAQSNEEIQAGAEEILVANKALTKVNDTLEDTVNERTLALTATTNRLATIIATTPIGLTILNGPDFVIEMANQPVLDIWGRTAEAAIGKKLLDVFPELADQPFPGMLTKVLDTGEPVRFTEIPVDVNQPDGSIKKFFVDFSYDPLFDLERKPEAILVSVKDITELAENKKLLHKRQEELEAMNEEVMASNEEIRTTNDELSATNEELSLTQNRLKELFDDLAESETRFRNLIRNAQVGVILLMGKDLQIEIANDEYARLIGGKAWELEGRKLFDVLPEAEAYYRPIIDQVRETGEPVYLYDHAYESINGGQTVAGYLNIIYQPYRELDGTITGVMVLCQDVTEQVSTREQLKQTLKEKITLSEDLHASRQRLQSILDTMAEGVIIIDADENIIYANSMAQRIFDLPEDGLKARRYNDEKWHNTRVDGSPLPEEDHPLRIMMRTGMTLVDQEVRVEREGTDPFFISINASPILDETGKITGGLATVMDVTNRRKLMQQKDEFISIASHELRTPVTSLKAALQLLERMKDKLTPETRDKLTAQANRSLDRLSSLIADLLNVNRISQGQLTLRKTWFKIDDLVNECCQHIRSAGTHIINLEGDVEIEIEADEQQIDQVLINLVNNAVKYAPESKVITIKVEKLEKEVKISVIDTGPGISREKLPHLFERYFRADYSGMQFSGLGLGLYISRAIVEKHNGRMGVESEVDKGSTFWFTLPM
jgi:PAS domain S-box-containing protein